MTTPSESEIKASIELALAERKYLRLRGFARPYLKRAAQREVAR